MPESAKPSIAVIGLGSMGFGMATSLRRAGFAVTGCDVSADSVARFTADGGKGAKTPAEAAKGADIVVSVVVNAAQTETILFGTGGAAETLGKGGVFISSCNNGPRRGAAARQAAGGDRGTLFGCADPEGGARGGPGEVPPFGSRRPLPFAQ